MSDVVGFVNGIPLTFIEFKAPHVDVTHAYDHNLTHYRDQIPQLFWFNGLAILSNGSDTRLGSFLCAVGPLRASAGRRSRTASPG